jgi:hypothetical protein
VVLNEQAEEVWQMNEALELFHVMFEVFLSGGIFPVFNRL